MRELTLIVTDLYLEGPAAAPTDSAPPRLPDLETLLARGNCLERGDWHEWICRRVALGARGRIPIAPIARFAHQQTPTAGQLWLAQCVHLEAGVDRVYLRNASPPSFSAEEWQAIESGFNRSFATSGQSLIEGRGSCAYLACEQPLDVETRDPARVRGSDIHAALPSGPDAVAAKRLLTEIQMWLHEHPVNMRREERGVETVNAMWIWGGGHLPDRGAAAVLPALYGDDPFLDGLWRLQGGAGFHLPASLDAVDLATNEAIVVALQSTPDAAQSHAQCMMALEQDWFAPAVAALRGGQLSRIQLHANDRLVALDRSGLWRIWRRPRRWVEVLA